MRLPGRPGEGRGHADEVGAGLGQRAIERRKAQVVADGEAEPPPGQIGEDRRRARPEARRLAIAFAARQVDVEHVDLVVAGGDAALGVEEIGAVGAACRLDLDGERADQQPDAELGGQRGEGRDGGMAGLRQDLFQQQRPPRLDHRGVLWRQHELGAQRVRGADPLGGDRHIGRQLRPGGELDAGRGEGPAHGEPASSGVSLPAASSA